ncbi:MAG: bifunctional hydroxymethylpyrimidine kinase/phosphomethylpyrimidine kinase [Candidatus Bathyarchaeia archaeon]
MFDLEVKKIPCALTIAGSDSGGGAGIQADLKTFAALGVHGMSAITSITAQNTVAVTAIQDVEEEVIKAQIDAVVSDIGVDAAKTGMLHTKNIIHCISKEIEEHGFPLVVDPVMVAKSGALLLKPEAIHSLINELLPLATVVTPNIMEAEKLSSIKINSTESMRECAKAISRLGPKAVVIKGGHIPIGKKVIDVLYYNGEFKTFEAEYIETKTTHGTGCSFSAAIAAGIAKGKEIPEAVELAKKFITQSIKHGIKIGKGHGPVNPMAMLFNECKKYYVLKNIKEAIKAIEQNPFFSSIIPESQSNIVMALPYAFDKTHVAGIPGRIVKVGNFAKASSCPEFGASHHVASAVLVAMKYDPSIRAGLNIKYSEELLEICKKMGLTISFYDRKLEPFEIKKVEGMSIKWGIEEAIKKIGKVPNIVYHTGDWGKEPMIVILGKTALEVSEVAIKIAEEYVKRNKGKT